MARGTEDVGGQRHDQRYGGKILIFFIFYILYMYFTLIAVQMGISTTSRMYGVALAYGGEISAWSI